jgi:hypothetical protein
MNIVINYFNSLKYIICSYIEFNNFKKSNLHSFGFWSDKVNFKFKILLIIIVKHFFNKVFLIFFFNKRKKFFLNYENKKINKFNTEWFKGNSFYWNEIFNKHLLNNKKIKILEIGSFEGRSTLFFLKNFSNSIISCVDTWKDSNFYQEFKLSKIEKNFDYNTKDFSLNLKKYKMTSDKFFKKYCKKKNNYYDIIYVDGDHYYETTFRDLISSFKVLKNNGLMIMDDFIGYKGFKNYNENPIGAIIVFINIFYKKIKILKITNQLIIKKIKL